MQSFIKSVIESQQTVSKLLTDAIKQVTVPAEEATAKYVPAAAVIRMSQALSGIIVITSRYQGNLRYF